MPHLTAMKLFRFEKAILHPVRDQWEHLQKKPPHISIQNHRWDCSTPLMSAWHQVTGHTTKIHHWPSKTIHAKIIHKASIKHGIASPVTHADYNPQTVCHTFLEPQASSWLPKRHHRNSWSQHTRKTPPVSGQEPSWEVHSNPGHAPPPPVHRYQSHQLWKSLPPLHLQRVQRGVNHEPPMSEMLWWGLWTPNFSD